ncbi:hypothetical protein L227DRAFT_428797 [Lentinus tigrinus ALCF2SS1-6]|uniref:Uncharacterized protein n=1 Tax=Lentinus tigrinus ALCF2SS1-6 TaxID=1328759 RepID=A0A5C2SFJ9_9APHY|nr:hypothetical protein L227DRAFT_428797 [Lentinus tigrinus ALCF2SS1-6]
MRAEAPYGPRRRASALRGGCGLWDTTQGSGAHLPLRQPTIRSRVKRIGGCCVLQCTSRLAQTGPRAPAKLDSDYSGAVVLRSPIFLPACSSRAPAAERFFLSQSGDRCVSCSDLTSGLFLTTFTQRDGSRSYTRGSGRSGGACHTGWLDYIEDEVIDVHVGSEQ